MWQRYDSGTSQLSRMILCVQQSNLFLKVWNHAGKQPGPTNIGNQCENLWVHVLKLGADKR